MMVTEKGPDRLEQFPVKAGRPNWPCVRFNQRQLADRQCVDDAVELFSDLRSKSS
jgi:hypothetical protein